MVNSKVTNGKLNNRGLSLVELIVAISIGVIVSGSIAALITFAIRTYRNESVNTSMQYELQTNLNMMMDEIMGASVFVVEQDSSVPISTSTEDAPGKPHTNYALFGKINTNGSEKKFNGVIFVSEQMSSPGKFKVYMDRIDDVYSATDIHAYADSKKGITSDNYLLGENLTEFVVRPVSGLDDSTNEYTNPIEFRVKLRFERNGWGGKVIRKHVDDVTFLRNKVTETVYVDGTAYNIRKKED